MYLFALSFALVFGLCFILIPISKRIGLIDSPDEDRKIHTLPTPLVGGIAIFMAVSIISLIFLPYSQDLIGLYIACLLLVTVGALDDKFNLSHWFRLGIQILSATILIYVANIELTSFGEIIWSLPINLGIFGSLITIIAVVGMINAFNMMDGMDGLASGISLVTFSSMFILLNTKIDPVPIKILLLISGALLAHFFLNLGGAKKSIGKIFMGDAGSMTVGFVITAFLIRYSQAPKQVFEPVIALWLVAVPLMDIIVTTLRRIAHNKSPFHPDKTHVHHILMHAGFSKHITLVIILLVQVLFCLAGLAMHKLHIHPCICLILFFVAFFFYYQIIKHAFRASKFIKKIISRTSDSH